MVFDLDSISNKMGAPSFAAVCEGRVPGALAVTACAAPNIPSEAEQLPNDLSPLCAAKSQIGNREVHALGIALTSLLKTGDHFCYTPCA